MATKYQEVADTVRKRIENGTYKVGELIRPNDFGSRVQGKSADR